VFGIGSHPIPSINVGTGFAHIALQLDSLRLMGASPFSNERGRPHRSIRTEIGLLTETNASLRL
jgi:hypothetical protein